MNMWFFNMLFVVVVFIYMGDNYINNVYNRWIKYKILNVKWFIDIFKVVGI